jgi:hypothetical protein
MSVSPSTLIKVPLENVRKGKSYLVESFLNRFDNTIGVFRERFRGRFICDGAGKYNDGRPYAIFIKPDPNGGPIPQNIFSCDSTDRCKIYKDTQAELNSPSHIGPRTARLMQADYTDRFRKGVRKNGKRAAFLADEEGPFQPPFSITKKRRMSSPRKSPTRKSPTRRSPTRRSPRGLDSDLNEGSESS